MMLDLLKTAYIVGALTNDQKMIEYAVNNGYVPSMFALDLMAEENLAEAFLAGQIVGRPVYLYSIVPGYDLDFCYIQPYAIIPSIAQTFSHPTLARYMEAL